MSANKVLLVGDYETLPFCVVEPLRQWGVPILISRSLADAFLLVKRIPFRMILSKLRLTDGSVVELIPFLAGQPADLFSYLSVQEGFLWLPLVISGQECESVRPLQTAAFLRLTEKRLKGAANGNAGETMPHALPRGSPFEIFAEHKP